MKVNARTRTRRLVLQGLYEWQISGNQPVKIEAQFLVEKDTKKINVDYFRELIIGVPRHIDEIDALISPLVDRSIDEIDAVERAALRLATYELLRHPEIPYRVIINESIELVKMFGAEQGYRFINGILDKLAEEIRSAEVNARKKTK